MVCHSRWSKIIPVAIENTESGYYYLKCSIGLQLLNTSSYAIGLWNVLSYYSCVSSGSVLLFASVAIILSLNVALVWIICSC